MNLGSLSIFRNSLQIREFARGYIAAMPLKNKYQDEYDEWHAFSDDIDINFYVIDGYMIDTDQEELIYEEKLLLKQLIKKETYK
jgi:hypothetical protein